MFNLLNTRHTHHCKWRSTFSTFFPEDLMKATTNLRWRLLHVSLRVECNLLKCEDPNWGVLCEHQPSCKKRREISPALFIGWQWCLYITDNNSSCSEDQFCCYYQAWAVSHIQSREAHRCSGKHLLKLYMCWRILEYILSKDFDLPTFFTSVILRIFCKK